MTCQIFRVGMVREGPPGNTMTKPGDEEFVEGPDQDITTEDVLRADLAACREALKRFADVTTRQHADGSHKTYDVPEMSVAIDRKSVV